MKKNLATSSYTVNWLVKQRGGVFGKDYFIFSCQMTKKKKIYPLISTSASKSPSQHELNIYYTYTKEVNGITLI